VRLKAPITLETGPGVEGNNLVRKALGGAPWLRFTRGHLLHVALQGTTRKNEYGHILIRGPEQQEIS